MDEAARQTSSHSLSSASTYGSATMRRPGSSQRHHRRTGSVGTVSEQEVNETCQYLDFTVISLHLAPLLSFLFVFRCDRSTTPRAPPSPLHPGFPSTLLPPWTRWTAFSAPASQTASSLQLWERLGVLTTQRYE